MDKIDAQTVERWEAWMACRPADDPPALLEGFREAFVKELER